MSALGVEPTIKVHDRTKRIEQRLYGGFAHERQFVGGDLDRHPGGRKSSAYAGSSGLA